MTAMNDALEALKARLLAARAERDQCKAAGRGDAYLVAHHYVRVLELRLQHWMQQHASDM